MYNEDFSLRSVSRMCAFHASSGCLHGAACDFAHDMSELQPVPDLRKSTLCINFVKGYVKSPSSRGYFYKGVAHYQIAASLMGSMN